MSAKNCKIENNVIAEQRRRRDRGGANVIVHNRIGSNAGGGILEFGASTIQQNVINGNILFGISDGAPPGDPHRSAAAYRERPAPTSSATRSATRSRSPCRRARHQLPESRV